MTTRERRILLGVCVDCESKELETERRCAGCNLAQRLYKASLRADRLQSGRCTQCGRRRAREGCLMCGNCQAYHVLKQKEKQERKQDGKQSF